MYVDFSYKDVLLAICDNRKINCEYQHSMLLLAPNTARFFPSCLVVGCGI